MKKLFVVLLIAIFILALAACGGEASSTTQGADTTTPAVTTPATTVPVTTTVAETTTTTPTTTQVKTPETTLSGIDILYGDEADRAIGVVYPRVHAMWITLGPIELDYSFSLFLKMIQSKNMIYEDLFTTVTDEYGDPTWACNPEYKWVLTIDGMSTEIERFYVDHDENNGIVYMDISEIYRKLADYDFPRALDVLLQIYRVETNEVQYYAWFTDPRYEGLYVYMPGFYDGFITLPPSAIEGASLVSGPQNAERLFDFDFKTKLRTADLATSIIWKYDNAVNVVAYTFFGARGDSSHPERVPIAWKMYGSNDGESWDLIDEKNYETPKEVSDYCERYEKLENAVAYSYFKLEMIAPTEYQLTEISLLSREYW